MDLVALEGAILNHQALLLDQQIEQTAYHRLSAGTLAIFPITQPPFRTLVIDGFEGIYLTTDSTRALMRQLSRTYYHLTIQARTEAMIIQEKLHLKHPMPVILVNNEYYFPLSGAIRRDAIWLAGQWLQEIDYQSAHEVIATFKIKHHTFKIAATTTMRRRQLSEMLQFASAVSSAHFASIQDGLARYLHTAENQSREIPKIPSILYKGLTSVVQEINEHEGLNFFGLSDLLYEGLTQSLI